MGTQVETSGWEVERKGIDWVREDERRGTPRSLFWPWAAANISFIPVAYGVFVVGLKLSGWQAAAAILAGNALSFPLVGLVALAGRRGGAPTLTLSRAAFGIHGNKLPTLFGYLTAVGWEIISVTVGSLAARTVLTRLDPSLGGPTAIALSFALIVGIVVTVGIYGFDVIMRVQRWITLFTGLMTVSYFVIVLPRLHLELSTPLPTGGPVLAGIILVFAAAISWTTMGADYSRYLPRDAHRGGVILWTALGGALPNMALMCFGVLLAVGNPDLAQAVATDPIGALSAQLPTWFLVPFMLSVLLSVIAGGIMNLYSSGLLLLAMGLPVRRTVAVSIDSTLIIAGGLYLIFLAPDFFAPFQSWLIVMGVGLGGWAAIFLADLLLFRRDGYRPADLYDPDGGYGRWNPRGVISMLISTAIGLGLVTSGDPYIGKVVGYLLSAETEAGPLGQSNIGVPIAFLIAGILYTGSSLLRRPELRS
ncbi:hypothetical protein D5S17_15400 [Pseudonocardiaceae bacterium YIM PH 21723]|nr:hypothetical protein D5S17_15400 [Pseudonocardiaceae bacterium YIM PH 21723]